MKEVFTLLFFPVLKSDTQNVFLIVKNKLYFSLSWAMIGIIISVGHITLPLISFFLYYVMTVDYSLKRHRETAASQLGAQLLIKENDIALHYKCNTALDKIKRPLLPHFLSEMILSTC